MIELYKDLIIDHGLNPRNKSKIKKYNYVGKAYNHFCGDTFDLYLLIENNCIKDISFYGDGCSISTASASLMTLEMKNKKIEHAKFLFSYFIKMIKKEILEKQPFDDINTLTYVNKFPSRVKCATLIWHTLHDILINNKNNYL